MLAGLSPPDPGGAKLSWKRSPFQNLPFLLPISRARQPPKNHQLKQTFRNQRHVHISITDVLQLIVSICSSHLFTIVRDDLVLNEHWNIYIYIIYIACLPFSIQQQHEPVHHSDCLQVKEKKKRTKTTLIYNRRAYCRYQENTLTLVDFFLALLHFPLFFFSFSSIPKTALQTDFTVYCWTRLFFSGGESKEKQMAMQPRRSQPRFCLVHKRVQKPRGAHCLCSIFLQKVRNYATGSSCKAITCNPHLRTTAQYLQTDFTKRFACKPITKHCSAMKVCGAVASHRSVHGHSCYGVAYKQNSEIGPLARRNSGCRLYSQNWRIQVDPSPRRRHSSAA